MSDKLFVGLGVTSVEDNGTLPPISRVTLMVDDNNAITAGDDTGREIVADCPFATQEMVNAILSRLKGYQYHAYTASDAGIDPAVELGDAVTVDNIYSVVTRIEDDGTGYPSISAPGEAELEDEYPSVGPVTQTFNRQISETRSLISKTSEEILLQVENELKGLSSSFSVQLDKISAELTDEINGLSASVDLKFDGLETSFEDKLNGLSADFDVKLNGLQANFEDEINGLSSTLNVKIDGIEASLEDEINGLSSSINLQIDSITSTVQGQGGQISQIQQTVTGISSQVSGLDGQVSSITQKVDNITLSVSNGSTSSSISLGVGGVVVSSQTIQMNGLVTFTGLANGTTTIDGACIKTGTIEADRLNLTGAITFSDLDTNTRGVINSASNNASTALSTAASVDMKVSGWTYPGTTEINGSAIRTGTVEASILRGGTVELLDQDGDRIGEFTIEPTGLAGLSSVTLSADELYFDAVNPDGQILFYTYDGTGIRIEPGGAIRCDGDFNPRRDDNFWLGSSSRAWQDLYVVNDPSVVSDKNRKKNITYDMSLYDLFFDSLRPTPYKLINGNSGRTHIGLISQDVEIALFDCGLTSLDFAGFIKSPLLDNNGEETGKYNYSLRYGEFVGLCIDQIQKLKSRISKLESQKQGA